MLRRFTIGAILCLAAVIAGVGGVRAARPSPPARQAITRHASPNWRRALQLRGAGLDRKYHLGRFSQSRS